MTGWRLRLSVFACLLAMLATWALVVAVVWFGR